MIKINSINHWSFVLSLGVMVCSVFEVISLNGKMKQTMNFVLGIFLMYCIVSPILNVRFDFKLDQSAQNQIEAKKENFSNKVEEQKNEVLKNLLKDELEKILEKENIKTERIEIFMDKDKDSCIVINKILVELSEKTKKNLEKTKEIMLENTKAKEVVVS